MRDRPEGYLPVRTEWEAQRLRNQAQLFDEATRAIFDRIPITPGIRALEVGCGAGDVMRLIADYVGPTGRVTGFDSNGPLGRSVVEELNSGSVSQFNFVEGNIEHYDVNLLDPFDLVVARFTSIHLNDPAAALGKLWSRLAVGGSLAVMDLDYRTIDACPQMKTIDEFKRIIIDLFGTARMDFTYGFKLPYYFEVAGVGRPDGVSATADIRSLHEPEVFQFVHEGYDSVRLASEHFERPQTSGAKADVTGDGPSFAERLASELEGREAQYFMMPLFVGAWKRKSS